MKYLLIILQFICCIHLNAQKDRHDIKVNNESKQIIPSLFVDLGESCSTPDGMAIDSAGNLFLAVTNLAKFEEHGSKILTFDENEKPTTWFDQLPLHLITKKVHPMGIEFGQDDSRNLQNKKLAVIKHKPLEK
ncbi:SMP-30/gluconolactonase/LRE family protein [bacterium]|nr:SMP-30/gluconolactonase/LRE family protein [bacterium]